jgi:hypothetical protein
VHPKSFTCPTGKLLHEGVCIGTKKKPAKDFDAANSTCLSERARLPTVAELQTFRSRAGQDFTSSPNAEWTSLVDFQGLAFGAHIVAPTGAIGWANYSTAEDYRCVAATTP